MFTTHVYIIKNTLTELIKHLKRTEINFFHNRITLQYHYLETSSKKEDFRS